MRGVLLSVLYMVIAMLSSAYNFDATLRYWINRVIRYSGTQADRYIDTV